jgi:5-methylcytosine-specific restriction protein A
MNEVEIVQAFASFRYATDEREPPDNLRRGQFRAGWGDATVRNQECTDSTLARLTRHNVG